jgi:hypothetical protein
VSRKIVTIGEEVFDFLAWKLPRRSFYARRSDGELSVVILKGSGLPLWATRFRCEFWDGTVIGFGHYRVDRVVRDAYELQPLSLSEISQLENVLQEPAESRKSKPAGKKVTPELSVKRSVAAKAGATVAHEGDRMEIKKAFLAKRDGGHTKRGAALLVAKYVNAKNNPLRLEGILYKRKVTPDIVLRIAREKK